MKYLSVIILAVLISFVACKEDPILKDDTPFELVYNTLESPDLPTDNPLTIQGVELGRMLFYETMLSKDGSQSCASCHRQIDGFSDTARFSTGVEQTLGRRHAMPIFNLAWHTNAFFWDGRSTLLREQALEPIQDPVEMNETLDNVITKLSNSERYQDQFARTFGSEEITAEKMALAMEQFMLSIVSSDSKFDRFLAGNAQLTASEERGRKLFFTEYNANFPNQSGADCAHCHGGANFENDLYMNNGLDTEANFSDLGRAEVTGKQFDRAKFKVPSLRNIAVTAPYMHDGRFQTLEEVIDHYNEGLQSSPTLSPRLIQIKNTGLFLGKTDKDDLVNFLKTLTDDVYLNNEAYKSPF